MKTTNFELKKETELNLKNVEISVGSIVNYVSDKNVGEWVDYKVHQHHLKKALPISLLCDLYHLDFYNCPEDTLIKDISLVYDSYSGQIGIWSEKFGCNENETYLEIQMDSEDEEYLETVVETYILICKNN